MGRILLDLPEQFPFSTDIPVRITDINYGGHLGNDKVLSVLHEARVRFLKSFGYTELDIDGRSIIMLDSIIVYKAEAFYGDVLKVEVAVRNMNNVGCDILYRVTNAQTAREIAHAKTGIAFFDYAKRKVVEMPERFKNVVGAD
jgi:acyl-CoA thioesterase FadM